MKKLLLTIAVAFIGIKGLAQAPTNGLVAYYGFQNNINSFNSTHNLSNAGATNVVYVAGKYGQGASFNGTSQALRNTTIGPTMTNTPALTIAFWQYKTVNTNYATTFDCFSSAFYRYGVNGSMVFAWAMNNTGWIQTQAGGLTTGVWQHIAYVYLNNGITTNVKLYVDGVNQSFNDSNANQAWNLYHYHHDITIGVGTNTNGTINSPTYFNGILDEFYIYNRALSAAEVVLVKEDNQGNLSSQIDISQTPKPLIYPNPTSNNFTIEMENEVKSVEIYSLQGQKVMSATSKNVNVSNLSKGMYLVRIEDENNAVATQKVVIE
jgi:hypothetical protein